MPRDKDAPPKEPTELGRRILAAIDDVNRADPKKKQTSLETEWTAVTGTSKKGYLSRFIYGDRGKSVEPGMIFSLARVLGVRPEWLWLGEEPRHDVAHVPARAREQQLERDLARAQRLIDEQSATIAELRAARERLPDRILPRPLPPPSTPPTPPPLKGRSTAKRLAASTTRKGTGNTK